MSTTVSETRFRRLQEVCQDRFELGLPLERVYELDRYLRAQWGIVPPPTPSDWWAGLESTVGSELASKYRFLHDRRAGYLARGKAIPTDLETRFYDLIAEQPLAGYVQTQKRPYILDAAALLDSIIIYVGLEGGVLDFGCHVGYHAQWLATRHPDLRVRGVDRSREAIKVAQAKGSEVSNLSFSHLRFDQVREGTYDLVFASDSLDFSRCKQAENLLHELSSSLNDGGILVLFGYYAGDPCSLLAKNFHACSLGYALADVTGGWLDRERGFEATAVLILVKGIESRLPEDFSAQCQSAWPSFREYANTPGVSWDDKTQAYHRARSRPDEQSLAHFEGSQPATTPGNG
jgi:SAM-dependent methyltransferase